jgi:formylglycine-generating enzyme required for sulfatase activity
MLNNETMKAESQIGNDFRDGPNFPEMVVLPVGSFMMGSNDHVSESPKKQIEIARPFCIGKLPVTFDEYDAFVLANLARILHKQGE